MKALVVVTAVLLLSSTLAASREHSSFPIMLLLERSMFRTCVRKRFDRRLVLSARSTPSPSLSPSRVRALHFSRSSRPLLLPAPPLSRSARARRPFLPPRPTCRDGGGFRRAAPPSLPTSLPRPTTSMQPERRATAAVSSEVGGFFSGALLLSPPPHLDLSSPPPSPPSPPTPALNLDLRDAAMARIPTSSVAVGLLCCCNK